MHRASTLSQIVQAFKIGAISVFYSYYRWLFIGAGFLLYVLNLLERHIATRFIGIINEQTQMMTIHKVGIIGLHFIFSFGRIGLVLVIIRGALLVFDHGFEGGKFRASVPSARKTGIYLLKGWILSQLVILMAAFIGIVVMIPLSFLLNRMLLVASTILIIDTTLNVLFYVLALIPFGFCCWVLLDKRATLRQCVNQSIDLSWPHKWFLALFYLIVVALMAALIRIPYAEVLVYSLYFPVALTTQGYLYRYFSAHQLSGFANKVPYQRPPVM